MSDHVLLPVLEDFKKRLEKIEEMLTELKTGKTEKKESLAMDEINDYLQKIHMA